MGGRKESSSAVSSNRGSLCVGACLTAYSFGGFHIVNAYCVLGTAPGPVAFHLSSIP